MSGVGGAADAAATIWAPASAPGRAATAIVRVSGPQAFAAAMALSGAQLPPPRRAVLRRFRNPSSGSPVDRGLLLLFAGPASFTGEDMAELHLHGGGGVAAAIAEALGDLAFVRPAEPGEFTRRSFLHGKLDLTQAEAVADLVAAGSAAQHRQALRQLEGELGRRVDGWRETLLRAQTAAEAEIDFAAEEGDVGDGLLSARLPELEALRRALGAAIDEGGKAQLLRNGVRAVILGPPNVGKSTLLNHLARREAAIVTALPGTTRDLVEVALEIGGVPVSLVDTAGLRRGGGEIEAIGMARAREAAAAADLVILVGAADCEATVEAPLGVAVLAVRNKVDLADDRTPPGDGAALGISLRTGVGVAAFERALDAEVAALALPEGGAVLSRARHLAAARDARAALGRLLDQPAELALQAEELRLAADALGRITGGITVDEILDRIFAEFCIGK